MTVMVELEAEIRTTPVVRQKKREKSGRSLEWNRSAHYALRRCYWELMQGPFHDARPIPREALVLG